MADTFNEASRTMRSSSSVASQVATSPGTSGWYVRPCVRRRAHRCISLAHCLAGSGRFGTSSSGGNGGGGGGTGHPTRSRRKVTGSRAIRRASRMADFSTLRIQESIVGSVAWFRSQRPSDRRRKAQRRPRISRRLPSIRPTPPNLRLASAGQNWGQCRDHRPSLSRRTLPTRAR